MKTVGVYEAKTNFSSLLDEVERGGAVTITRHGKPVARLEPAAIPERDPKEIIATLAEFETFRNEHRGALAGLALRELIEYGRKY